jgi:transcriptional regulator with XRE-family HTH domain
MSEQVYVPRMSNTQEAAPPAVVRLKADAYAAWTTRMKLAGDERQAAYLGVSRSNLGKVRRGEIKPGEQFIAALLAASGRRFEYFFEIAEAS